MELKFENIYKNAINPLNTHVLDIINSFLYLNEVQMMMEAFLFTELYNLTFILQITGIGDKRDVRTVKGK